MTKLEKLIEKLGATNYDDALEKASAINLSGSRDNADGTTTVQLAKRSDQINQITEYIYSQLQEAKKLTYADTKRQGYYEGVTFITVPEKVIRDILAYTNTLGRIGEELKNAGK